MTAAACLLLAFIFGAVTGALALYTLWRVAIASPAYWAEVFTRVADIFPPGRWVRLGEKHLCMHCPACGHSESSQ